MRLRFIVVDSLFPNNRYILHRNIRKMAGFLISFVITGGLLYTWGVIAELYCNNMLKESANVVEVS